MKSEIMENVSIKNDHVTSKPYEAGEEQKSRVEQDVVGGCLNKNQASERKSFKAGCGGGMFKQEPGK